VLSFLSLHELAAALSVNKEWSAAVQTMRPAMLIADISAKELDGMLASHLRRHVGQLGQVTRGALKLSSPPLQLSVLTRAVPQLRSLTACLQLPLSAAAPLPLTFPPHLQRLQLSLPEPDWDQPPTSSHVDPLLAAISQLQQLHTLDLQLQSSAVSLTPLQQLPLLRDLQVEASFPDAQAFAAQLHALRWLHRLRITTRYEGEHYPVDLFNALLRDAPDKELRVLKWRDFGFVDLRLTDEVTSLLCRLPLLERLEANLSRCTRFDFLSALPQLTHLELQLWGMQRAELLNLLRIFTSNGLTCLHTLVLRGGPCTSDDLSNLLPHTPSLRSLMLARLGRVSSLSFFRHLSLLPHTLTHLTVECRYTRDLIAADLRSLLVLQQLRELRLLNWPAKEPAMLRAEDRAPFEARPCIVLPRLEIFEWTIL
jgi:hypothetical protein